MNHTGQSLNRISKGSSHTPCCLVTLRTVKCDDPSMAEWGRRRTLLVLTISLRVIAYGKNVDVHVANQLENIPLLSRIKVKYYLVDKRYVFFRF